MLLVEAVRRLVALSPQVDHDVGLDKHDDTVECHLLVVRCGGLGWYITAGWLKRNI